METNLNATHHAAAFEYDLRNGEAGMATMLPTALSVDSSNGPFNYSMLDQLAADRARSTAERICSRLEQNIIETGRDLIAVKQMLDHGNFGKRLKAEFGWTDRTARNLMSAAELADSKSEIVSVLPATAVYRLAAPSTPEVARDAIIARLEQGEILSTKEIKDVIAVAREKAAADLAAKAKLDRKLRGKSPEDQERIKRQEERRRRKAEREAEQEALHRQQREQAAEEAVELLKQRLGANLPAFVQLLGRADEWSVLHALRRLSEKEDAVDGRADAQSAEPTMVASTVGCAEDAESAGREARPLTHADPGNIPDFLRRFNPERPNEQGGPT